MKRILRYFLIFVYIGICLIVSLYLQFPSEAVLKLMRNQVAQLDPEWTLDGRTVEPTWPAGLELKKARITYQGNRVAEPDWIRLSSTLGSMLRKAPETRLSAKVWDGSLDIQVFWDDWNLDRFSKAVVDADALELGNLPYGSFAPEGTDLSGTLSVDGEANLKNGKPETGMLKVVVSNCRIEAPIPMIPKMPFVFDRVDLLAKLRNGKLEVSEGVFSGELMSGSVKGDVSLSGRFTRSRLNLELTLVPTPVFMEKLGAASSLLRSAMRSNGGKELKIRLQGTIEHPRIRT